MPVCTCKSREDLCVRTNNMIKEITNSKAMYLQILERIIKQVNGILQMIRHHH